jgi:hypothetical protein
MVIEKINRLDATLRTRFPRARVWMWFFGLYLAGLGSLAVFAYGMRWLIKG